MKDEDDSGDEAEARHLLEKRREQAKYDAVRGDSDHADFWSPSTKTDVARHEGRRVCALY